MNINLKAPALLMKDFKKFVRKLYYVIFQIQSLHRNTKDCRDNR